MTPQTPLCFRIYALDFTAQIIVNNGLVTALEKPVRKLAWAHFSQVVTVCERNGWIIQQERP